MKVNNYTYLQDNLLLIILETGQKKWIRLDDNSGKILTRPKVDSLTKVQHPGIWLGTDYNTGESYVIHNHYHFGGAHIATFSAYAAGQQVSWKAGRCTNDPMRVINTGLAHVVSGKPYDLLNYNCQTFANTACYNKPVSEDVNKWFEVVLGVLLVGVAVTALKA